MDKEKIDFLKNLANENPAALEHGKRRRFGVGKTLFSALALILIFSLAYTKDVLVAGNNLVAQFGSGSIVSAFRFLVGAGDRKIAGENEDRINILLLGIGGEQHPGGQLTDTIIVASLRPSDGAAALLSIPRDLVAPIPNVGWKKINYAQAYGRAQAGDEKDAGPRVAAQTVENITDLPIHYYVKLDFAGFKKIVDALGGIRVNVPDGFTDNQYPDENFGFAPVSFEAGWQNFDGERALKYARSRHGNNKQGSDFARAGRQQALLSAFQTKLLSFSTLLQPQKIAKAIEALEEHLETNLEVWQALRLVALAKKVNADKVKQLTLSNAPDGLLVSEIGEDGAYNLRPRLGAGNFSEIQKLAQNALDENPYSGIARVEEKSRQADESASSSDKQLKPEPEVKPTSAPKEPIRVAVQNGTTYPGLAAHTAALLEKLSFRVVQVGNAPRRDYEKTIIFKLSPANFDRAGKVLQDQLNAILAPAVPSSLQAPAADFLIIVGQDNIPENTLSLSNILDFLFHLL